MEIIARVIESTKWLLLIYRLMLMTFIKVAIDQIYEMVFEKPEDLIYTRALNLCYYKAYKYTFELLLIQRARSVTDHVSFQHLLRMIVKCIA